MFRSKPSGKTFREGFGSDIVREGHTNLDQSFTFNFDVTKYLMSKKGKIDSNFVAFSQYLNVT